MATYDLGTARGVIELDASSLGRASAALGYIGNRMILLGAAALAGFGYAVKAAADFEQQLARFGAVTDTNKKDMEALRQKALQLGRDSAFGATEVATAFVELGKSGRTAQDVLNGMGDAAVYLAAAGEIPLVDATDTLINVINQFGLKATDAVRVANLLAGAANASTSEVTDLKNSLRYAGPVAAMAGISFKDTATILALFANAGIKGSQAGTSLRAMLLGIAATTPKAEKTLRQLGIVTLDGTNRFYDMYGKLKPMPEVFQILSDAMQGLTPHQQQIALNAIFQRRALTGAALAAKDGALGFLAMREEITKTTAHDVMVKKLDTLQGSLKILKASVETLAITIGEKFQKPLKATADVLRNITNWFIRLDPRIQEAAGWALFAFGAFLLFGGALFKTMQYSVQAYKAFRDLAGALQLVGAMGWEAAAGIWAALGPLLLIVIALLLIAAVAYVVYKKWDQIWTWIKNHPAYAAIILFLLSIINPLILVGIVIGALAKNWKTVWEHIKAWTSDAANWIKNAFNDVIHFFEGPFKTFFTTTLPGWFKELPGKLETLGSDAGNALVRGFHSIFDNFPAKVGFVLGLVVAEIIRFVTQLPIWALNGAAGFLNTFAAIMENLIPWIMDLGARFILQVATWIVQLYTNLPGWLYIALTKFWDWGNQVVDSAVQTGLRFLGEVGNWAMQIWPRILFFIAGIPGQLVSWGLQMMGGFLNGLNFGLGGVLGFFGGLFMQMIGAMGNITGAMLNVGVSIMEGFLEGLRQVGKRIMNWVGNLVSDIVSKIGSALKVWSPSRVMFRLGQQTALGLLKGLESVSPTIIASVGTTAAAIPAAATAGMRAGGAAPASGNGILVDHFSVTVTGVPDTTTARAVGEAVYEGFSAATARRQIQMSVKAI